MMSFVTIFFWHLATTGPAAKVPAEPPAPLQRVGLILGTAEAMMLFYLNWLVCGCFLAKKVISQMAFLPAQMRKGGQDHQGQY
jgi:hypothetical protein